MALWYELASLPLKSVMKTLQSLPIESENGRDRNDLGNHSEPDFYTEKNIDERKKDTKLRNNHKKYDSEASSDNDSESTSSSEASEDLIEIDESLRLDDEEAANFISSDINEKNLQKFLQREMDFYTKAFPQAVLRRKSSSAFTQLRQYEPMGNNSLRRHSSQHHEDCSFNSLRLR